jgi:tRNA(fMet)-specific endonuclease VapC
MSAMKFMLDTSICVELIRHRNANVLRRMKRLPPDEICVSAVTLGELEYGAAKSADSRKNRLALAEFMVPIAVAPYDDKAAACYGHVRSALESKGTPIGPLDTMIAAHALSLGVTLVTDNEREFCRVADLEVQNWTK